MKLGVALCTYNGERYLPRQLESLLEQTRRPDLVVISDDASSDGTRAQIEAWARRAPFEVKVAINSANLGYLRNFERAIALCEAELIVLSDQDDRWHPDKLAKLEAAIAPDASAGGVFSDAEIVDADLDRLGYGLLDVLRVSAAERALAAAGDLFPVLLRRNVVAGANLAFRGSWKTRVLPLPAGVVHDEWIALVIAASGGMRFVPDRLIDYRQHGANQIGARRWSAAERLQSLGQSRRGENERVLALMRQLRERLSAQAVPAGRLRAIEGKIAHLERRVALPDLRLLRLPALAAECMTGRYGRYSSGWRAVVRDLVSPG
jgi:glycosyltransferase involved in cell wall biosynthesis